MKIVWVRSEYLFPLDTGSKIRTHNLLKQLNRELEVTYLGFATVDKRGEDPNLAACARRSITLVRSSEQKTGAAFYFRVASNLGSRFPYFVKRNRDVRMRQALRTLVRERACQVIVCDALDASLNIDFDAPVPKVLLHHSVETHLWRQRYEATADFVRRAYFNYETKRMGAFEGEMCRRFDVIVAVSDNDRDSLQSDFKVTKPIEVIPTGVDCSYFRLDAGVAVIAHRLMFSGSLELLSNIDQLLWFASEIYPLIKHRYPDVTLDIVGRDPAAEIVALGQKDRSIRVTGWVEDIRPYLAQTDLYIVPLRLPGGTRVKVYEAMAMKKPVVSTSYGVEGLAVKHGLHVLLADAPREFADAVCRLWDNPEQKAALADRAWRLVNEQCDWSVMGSQMIALCRRLAAPGAP